MRYYHLDGSYQDYPLDTEFGWYFEDIVVDEAVPTFHQQNDIIKDISRTQRSKNYNESVDDSDEVAVVEELANAVEDLAPKPTLIHTIVTNIKEETPTNAIINHRSVEGFIESPEANFYKQVKNSEIPSKQDLMALINPVNPESKALLGVISHSKYTRLNDKETGEEVLKMINFKTTKSKHMINEKGCDIPDINFLLSDSEVDVSKQLVSEIRNYHATKEENMLSLMMELIITGMDSSLGDMSELNNSLNELNNASTATAVETSDLGNSIPSSLINKEGNCFNEKKHSSLEIPNRSDILSSIGLSGDIDRSIENIMEEKSEMHRQLVEIRKSFEVDQKKINSLLNQATALQNDLRETAYLDNLIHLLKSEPKKVKNKRLPFRIFHQSIDDLESNANLII